VAINRQHNILIRVASLSETTGIGTPSEIKILACECLKLCNDTPCNPALRSSSATRAPILSGL
jgi:hypothetical protein